MLLVCPKTNVIWSPRCYQIRLRSPFGISWESEFWPLLTSHVAWSWWQAQVNNEILLTFPRLFQFAHFSMIWGHIYIHTCAALARLIMISSMINVDDQDESGLRLHVSCAWHLQGLLYWVIDFQRIPRINIYLRTRQSECNWTIKVFNL